jgi:hypothetical protein
MPITGDEYAQIAADVQQQAAEIITSVVTVGAPPVMQSLVLTEDPVDLDEAQWAGALLSENDLDENGDKRVHAWIVTFAGSDQLESGQVRSIEPKFHLRVQVFYTHDAGSESRIRAECLKVQYAIAEAPKMNMPGVVTRHEQLPIRLRLARLGTRILHRGEGELVLDVQPLNVY